MPNKVVSINTGRHRATVRARRDELVESHLSLVEGIARAVARNLPPSFDLDDLIGEGNLALMRAATRYRPGAHGGAPFSAYARQVIRGAVIESIRRKRYLENTRPGLEVLAQPGTDEDFDCAALMRAATVPGHDVAIDKRRMARRLAEAVSWLPEDQQRVLRLYYDAGEPTLTQVAARIAETPQHTRKTHALAVEALRARFKLAA